MARGNRYVLLSHCLLNVNAKVLGYGSYSGAMKSLVLPIIEEGIGIFQLPCAEATFGGLKRWGMTMEQYDTPAYRRHCRWLLEPVMDQVQDDIANDVSVLGVIGIDGSPSCGVHQTCYGYCGGTIGSGDWVDRSTKSVRLDRGQGVFMRILSEMMAERGLSIPMTSIFEGEPSRVSWEEIKKELQG
nr:CD3072 family TudS-related putative desulfidase [uncultured Dethiosulfovibrio sp.]